MTLAIIGNQEPIRWPESSGFAAFDETKLISLSQETFRLVAFDKAMEGRDIAAFKTELSEFIQKKQLDCVPEGTPSPQSSKAWRPKKSSPQVVLSPRAKLRHQVTGPIMDLYGEDAREPQKVDERARKILGDAQKLQIGGHPLYPVLGCENGPTYIVEHPSNVTHPNAEYVIKHVHWKEILCGRIYDFFWKAGLPYNCGFITPETIGLDLTKGIQDKPDGKRCHLKPDICSALQKTFSNLREMVSPGVTPQGNTMMIAQRIHGENLSDFVGVKYSTLTLPGKQKMFRRLGRLTLFDLLMGNYDRLIRFELYSGENLAQPGDDVNHCTYRLNHEPANLGNIMSVLNSETNDLTLFAIDNSIDPKLVQDKYYEFLRDLFKKDDVSHQLSESVMQSIKNAISVAPKPSAQARENFDTFKRDLESDVLKAALKEGMETMAELLRKDLLPKWKTQSALKANIESDDPSLLDGIEKRFSLLQ